ncbi:hypothetical protein CRE_21696 [Caenorhabditis remanei]|uniref:Uncharacterized protein n=1 Tax=Caenorhabditis remanei TaxID=31234 RepID=E3NUN4_CAERE|nr:hypothetical protein CRE_21696 [Caenorhabditis remanei]
MSRVRVQRTAHHDLPHRSNSDGSDPHHQPRPGGRSDPHRRAPRCPKPAR